MSLNSTWYEGIAGLEQLRGDWYELTQGAHLFARYEWYFAATKDLVGESRSVLFCRISDEEDRPLSIIPFSVATAVIRPFGELPALTLDWDSQLVTFDFPLAKSANPLAVAETMLKAFKEKEKSWQVISWPRVMENSTPALLAAALGEKRVDFRSSSVCNSFCTATNPDPASGFEVYSVKSSNLKHNLTSRLRRLSKKGPVQMRMARDEGADIDVFFEEFLRLESSGWKGRGGSGTAIALVPAARAFYSTLLINHSKDFETDIALLYCGEKAVAGQFIIRVARWAHIYKIGYDEDYAAFSPGQLLNLLVIEHAKTSECVDRVSLVTGLEWHKKWDPISEPTMSINIYRNTWRMKLVSLLRLALKVVKRLRSGTMKTVPISRNA